MNYNLIIDFDSTIAGLEGLDELAKICLKNNKNKQLLVKKIQSITNNGMLGKITFNESLKQRLNLFKPTTNNVSELVILLNKNISQSFIKNKNFIKRNKNNIYVVSGGFKEWIIPITKQLSIKNENVFANTFTLNNKKQISGFNKNNPLSKAKGKIEVVKNLNLKGKKIVVGDGYTDYEIVKYKQADLFFAYTEFVKRDEIVNLANKELKNFSQIINYIEQEI